MKVVVLTGPESTGKTWLAGRLRQHFDGQVVGEYVREFVDTLTRDTVYEDVETIARIQLQREDAARLAGPQLLILDTHLLSNRLWSEVLFKRAPAWFESALRQRHYDLHLLLSPEGADWRADGQRCQPELADRLRFYDGCRQWLEAHRHPYIAVGGEWEARERCAIAAVRSLLDQPA